jgi:uncharacterized membrane protein HdeD (DUF308 family)
MRTLADRWSLLALRGAVAIIFALICWAEPGAGLLAIITIVSAYVLADGVLSIALGIRLRGSESWGGLVVHGIVGVVAALLVAAWPGIGVLALLGLVAAWAILTGVSEITVAVRLRKLIQGEWALILLGIVSIVFGISLLVAPAVGALVVTLWIGTFAFISGVLSLVVAFRLRALRHRGEIPTLPIGTTPPMPT